MKKLFLYTIAFLSFFSTLAQDYQAIDLYLKEKIDIQTHTEQGEFESLNILLTTNDCDNCIPMLYNYIKDVKEKKPYTVNIITDNKAYAKKTLGNAVNFKYNLYYDKEVFSKFLKGRSGIYYIDTNSTIYDDDKDIRVKLKNAEDRQEFFMSLNNNPKIQLLAQDSLMSNPPFITSTVLPNNQLLIFDNKMDVALVLNIIDNTDSLVVTKKSYFTPTIKNSIKLFNLPGLGDNGLSFEESQKTSQYFLKNMIKLYSITYSNQRYYATFSVTRAYKKDNNIRFFSTYFVGTTKATKINPETILDASTYDSYYQIDDLPYEGKNYRIITDTRTKPQIVTDNELKWRVRMPDDNKRKVTYSGLATLELKNQMVNMTGIDTKFEEFIDLNALIKWKNKTYYLSRHITDEENNQGYLFLQEFNSTYINEYAEKVETL
ncbi:hypothetical protein [Myroides odoratus]|uniref:hypothetical protein n=1 Tax=Myroides odoratus TaxID=256 RepID=UPI0007661400|nr:hypothetical protein [Myroides odoratus]